MHTTIRRRSLGWFMILVVLNSLALNARAQQALLPFQGQLTDQTGVSLSPTAPLTLIFRLYENPVGGAVVWEEAHPNIDVIAGRFTALLGSRNPFPNPKQFSKTVYLGITLDDGDPSTADVEMRPRQAIVPLIYALNSGNVEKLAGQDWSSLLVGGSIDPSTAKIRADKVDLDALLKRVANLERNSVPVGTILAYGGPVDDARLDSGMWKVCNGEALSRDEFRTLFEVIKTSWGMGDGSTTFNLPDLLGRFLRGIDARATPLNSDVPKSVGSKQGDSTRMPNARFQTDFKGPHSHTYSRHSGTLIPIYNGVPLNHSHSNHDIAGNDFRDLTTGLDGGHLHGLTGGDVETRPVSAPVIWIIRVK